VCNCKYWGQNCTHRCLGRLKGDNCKERCDCFIFFCNETESDINCLMENEQKILQMSVSSSVITVIVLLIGTFICIKTRNGK
jgi:hypothetical protein